MATAARGPRKAVARKKAPKDELEEPTSVAVAPPSPDPKVEIIPGYTLADITSVVSQAEADGTGQLVMAGLRTLISQHGHDPDLILTQASSAQPQTPGQEETADEPLRAYVVFHGQSLEFQPPTPAQMGILRRTESRFKLAGRQKEFTGEEIGDLCDDATSIVMSLMTRKDDKRFLRDLILDREADIMPGRDDSILDLLTDAMKELGRVARERGNRAERRKAAKSSEQIGRATLDTAE